MPILHRFVTFSAVENVHMYIKVAFMIASQFYLKNYLNLKEFCIIGGVRNISGRCT